MARIIDLTSSTTAAAGDNLPFWSASNGDTRRMSMTAVANYVQTVISGNDDKVLQYASPAVNAFNVAITDSSASIWLVMTPLGAFAAGTITLPALVNCVDRQEILVNSTQAVAALTVSGNGSSVVGAPGALAANGYFLLRYEPVSHTWYRIG